MERFGVVQPTHTGGFKLRAIDNGKGSLSNAMTRTRETIPLPDVPRLAIGLDDKKDAYRHIPNSQPGFSIFMMYNPTLRRMQCHETYGLPFGLTSAVINFCRFPALVSRFARLRYALTILRRRHDRRGSQERCCHGATIIECLNHPCTKLGLPQAPEKHKEAADTNIALGVMCDVSRAHEPGGPPSLLQALVGGTSHP